MARTNINIKITQQIEIPDGFICSGKRNCSALTEVEQENARICSYFNKYVFWSDRGGFFQKCSDCVDATMKYFGEADD